MHSSPDDKIRPFRLVKYFTFSSLTVIFLGTIILCFLNIHWARTLQFNQSEEYALLLTENLNHQIYTQFQIPVYYIFGKIQLRNKRQFELMDKIVRSTLHSFRIDMVNLYDVNDNIISYSFDPALVGKRDRGGDEYRNAVKGNAVSKLVQEGNFWEKLLGFPKKIKVITFAPLREAKPLTRISGKVLGVVEIVQDLSDDYQSIFRYQVRVILTSTMVMGILLGVLIFVVKRGEGIIEQRTVERMRLREQLNRAERLSALGEMVAGISHEIRNPLGIIRSSAELLKKKMQQNGQSNSIADVVVEESSRLNNIITDFLAYAKPVPPNRSLCRAGDILEKNISFLGPQMEEGGYSVKIQQEEALPEISADPDMLYQVFLNILMNAMQSMPGGGEIHIDMTADREKLCIAFKDKGPGIPEDILNKIWDPFFTTKETGTGLGLGIVKNIIEAHSGNIRMENRPIYGAQIIIELPVTAE